MKEMIRRAARTFFQAAAGYVTGVISGAIRLPTLGENVLACLLLCAVAAGLAALMNLPADDNGEVGTEEKNGENGNN